MSSYVPKSNWEGGGSTGLSVVQVEGTGIPSAVISTPKDVNSCSSNSVTGETVCVANNTDVYLIMGSTLNSTLTSGASGSNGFSGGSCMNCGVTFNSTTNQALIGLSTATGPGYQFLDLAGASPTLETPFASPATEISEDLAIDPQRNFILSANEDGSYEIVNIASTTAPIFFENFTNLGQVFDSSAEDCGTGIALSSDEGTGNVFLADLTQATFTPGSPSGTWSAPSQLENFPEFLGLEVGTCGIAVAAGSHIAEVAGEFGGSGFGAIQLPSTSGTGTPAAVDYIECNVPNDPNNNPWNLGADPHTSTAYTSPNTGDAIALFENAAPPTFLAAVDMTKLLNPSIVARITNGQPTAHTCDPTVNLVTAGVVTFVAVP